MLNTVDGLINGTSDLLIFDGINLRSSFNFRKEKCWMRGAVCVGAEGTASFSAVDNTYVATVSGAAWLRGAGRDLRKSFSLRTRIAPQCFWQNLADLGKAGVCFTELNLPRSFKIEGRACTTLPVIGEQCFTIFSQQVRLVNGAEVRALAPSLRGEGSELMDNTTVAMIIDTDDCGCGCEGEAAREVAPTTLNASAFRFTGQLSGEIRPMF